MKRRVALALPVVYYSDATQLLKLTQTGQSRTNQQLPPSAGG